MSSERSDWGRLVFETLKKNERKKDRLVEP